MTQTLALADSILKDFYEGPVIEQINQKTYLLDQIERDTERTIIEGRRVIVPLHKNRNRGRGSIGDGGNLPKGGQQEFSDAIVKVRYNYYGIEITDPSIQATKGQEGAFISLLKAETEGVATDMKKDMQRQAYGTGDGLLGTCGVTGGSKTVEMGSAFDVQYIGIGDVVDIIKKSNGETSTGAVATKVTGRSVANKTITVEASVTTDNTFGVYISGDRNNETDGLRNITAKERTLHEIDSTAAGNTFWNGNVLQAGESLSKLSIAGEDSFIQLFDKIAEAGNGDVEVCLTTQGIVRRLANQYQSQKRFTNGEATQINGGYKALMVNDVPVVADVDCPKTFAFAFNKKALAWFELTKPGWMEAPGGNGSYFFPKNAGTGLVSAAWQAWWRWYAAFGTKAANRTGRLEFCADDNPRE